MIRPQYLINNFLVLSLILLSGSIFQVAFFIPTFTLASFFSFVSFISIDKFRRNQFEVFAISILFFTSLFILNFILSKSSEFKDYLIAILQIFLTITIVLSFKLREVDVLKHINIVLKYILLFSLIGFIFSLLGLGKHVILGNDFGVYTFGYLFYYSAEWILSPIVVYRSQGIFWEAGLLAIYANIFLFISLFINKNNKNSAIAIITIITAFSTTGLFLAGFQLLIQLIQSKRSFFRKLFLIGISTIPLFFTFIYSLSAKKTEGETRAISSYALRTFDMYSGSMIAIDNPLFGVGLNSSVYIAERDKYLTVEMEEIFSLIEDRGNSNSVLLILGWFGFLIGLLFFYFLYKQDIIEKNRLVFFILIMVSLTSEPVFLTPFFLLFIVRGFQKQLI